MTKAFRWAIVMFCRKRKQFDMTDVTHLRLACEP